MDTPDSSHSRIIRSFALREDAVRAKAALDDAGIKCSVREYKVPDPLTKELKTRALNLCISPSDAQTAARIMLTLPPSEAPAAATARPEGPTRLRRGRGRPEKQKSSLFIVGFAVLCAAGMIIFVATAYFGPKPVKGPKPSTANIVVEEDLNYDGTPDVRREFTWDHIPIYHVEDRNYDGEMDLRWIWQRGIPAYRDEDLNYDGRFDVRTVYGQDSQQFYSDTRPGGTGPVQQRRIFRETLLWKVLEDRDQDSHFDHIIEYNDLGDVVRNEDLPKGSPEDNMPSWPVPPWPERDDEGNVIQARPASP